jgi:hypothetical protein
MGRTTNGGFNWVVTTEDSAFTDIHFIDSLTGWMAGGNLKKTTDGGLNWSYQILPHGSNFVSSGISHFSFINKDTIFGVGGFIYYPYPKWRGIIYKTTNGGINWGYQLPDTSFGISLFGYIKFVDKQRGWAYGFDTKIIHTTTGGSDSTFFTGIINNNNSLIRNFNLYQNYPNPFNPSTTIEFSLNTKSNITLTIFDLTSKEITKLINKEYLNPGNYKKIADFSKLNLSSGIYFYELISVDRNKNIYRDTKKMIYLK